ncbi:MAG: phospholipid carrier-dependent glycosyltransferase, partial [Chloroflexaceae bacterium]|nr:phospholipid carrier-dependent glycosyltransferase [Chloroflexaceae bacterium]
MIHPTAPPLAASESHISSRTLPGWVGAVLLGITALALRGLQLSDFFTVDESFHWVWRVQHFTGSIRQERWADTNLTGHPGVTTLWLGLLGRRLALALGVSTEGLAEGSAAIGYLALLRLPLAIVHSLAVASGYLLLRRLFTPTLALLAGILWAASPFLIAHSRLLHLDALLTSFMMLSMLLLLVALLPPTDEPTPAPRWQMWLALLGSSVCAGLALLTKAPSLLLLPVAGLTMLFFGPEAGLWARLRGAVLRYLPWLACAVAVFWALWPAMWVIPGQAIASVLEEIFGNGAVPHHTGNFFLGQPVADPGPLFYLAVIGFRTTPITLIGLLLLPLALR